MPPNGRPSLASGRNARLALLDYIQSRQPVTEPCRAIGRALGFSHVAILNQLHALQADGLIRRTSRGWEVA